MESLELNSKSPLVNILQSYLKVLGHYQGEIGDTFDSDTKTAVKAFQKATNLTEDGKANEVTWTALIQRFEPILPQGDGELKNLLTQVITAKSAAEAAKTQAVSAKDEAEAAKTQAVSAKDDAEAAKTQAVSAKDDAEAAKTQAVSAKDDAETAKTQAVSAKDDAEAAKTQAVSAKNDAEAAKTQAEMAKSSAQTAQTSAETAKTEAEIQALRASASASAVRAREAARRADLAYSEAIAIRDKVKTLTDEISALANTAETDADNIFIKNPTFAKESAKQATDIKNNAEKEFSEAERLLNTAQEQAAAASTAAKEAESQEIAAIAAKETLIARTATEAVVAQEKAAKDAETEVHGKLKAIQDIESNLTVSKSNVEKLVKAIKEGLPPPDLRGSGGESKNWTALRTLFFEKKAEPANTEPPANQEPEELSNLDEFQKLFNLRKSPVNSKSSEDTAEVKAAREKAITNATAAAVSAAEASRRATGVLAEAIAVHGKIKATMSDISSLVKSVKEAAGNDAATNANNHANVAQNELQKAVKALNEAEVKLTVAIKAADEAEAQQKAVVDAKTTVAVQTASQQVVAQEKVVKDAEMAINQAFEQIKTAETKITILKNEIAKLKLVPTTVNQSTTPASALAGTAGRTT